MVAEPTALYAVPTSPKEYQQQIKKLEQQMYKFAQDLEFEKAAAVRDQLQQLRESFMLSGEWKCGRFQGRIFLDKAGGGFLQEFYQVAFRKRIYTDWETLQTDLDEWGL